MQLTDAGKIYKDHEKAFSHVSAYVVCDSKGERVATVAFKFAKSGMRTTCYFHIIGLPMVRAYASGGGYDKCSAAAHSAAQRVKHNSIGTSHSEALQAAIKDTGQHWDADLREAGFQVLQAV